MYILQRLRFRSPYSKHTWCFDGVSHSVFFEQLALCHRNLLGVAGVAAFRAVVKSDRVPFEKSGV